MSYEWDYANLVQEVLREGDLRNTRNHPTRAVFGKMLTVQELVHGEFPILTGRKMYPKGVFGELAAFLKGPKTVKDFEDEGCNYWNKWGDDDGNLTVDYGNSWLDYNGVNQLESVLDSIATDPTGRRHIISGWRPDMVSGLSLPCCHLLYQWFVKGDYLEMIWYQRSVDMMVGLPSDVILAAAWNIMMAEHVGLKPGKLVFMLGDCHVYDSHIESGAVAKYLNRYREGYAPDYFSEGTLHEFNKDSISLIDYQPQSSISFEVHA